ncbi:hypothetical protein BIW11_05913 [Tropilaelaps mercedesae]|uniref:Uncharacterized protein n=1 Tax=Tropilaelaps mercedesae TaxID=418985 RepID=A0A1V9Y0Q4_9ACAR|nr:hypothetical protein BIW11_05913 [Tropilaelaps mercedesae]
MGLTNDTESLEESNKVSAQVPDTLNILESREAEEVQVDAVEPRDPRFDESTMLEQEFEHDCSHTVQSDATHSANADRAENISVPTRAPYKTEVERVNSTASARVRTNSSKSLTSSDKRSGPKAGSSAGERRGSEFTAKPKAVSLYKKKGSFKADNAKAPQDAVVIRNLTPDCECCNLQTINGTAARQTCNDAALGDTAPAQTMYSSLGNIPNSREFKLNNFFDRKKQFLRNSEEVHDKLCRKSTRSVQDVQSPGCKTSFEETELPRCPETGHDAESAREVKSKKNVERLLATGLSWEAESYRGKEVSHISEGPRDAGPAQETRPLSYEDIINQDIVSSQETSTQDTTSTGFSELTLDGGTSRYESSSCKCVRSVTAAHDRLSTHNGSIEYDVFNQQRSTGAGAGRSNRPASGGRLAQMENDPPRTQAVSTIDANPRVQIAIQSIQTNDRESEDIKAQGDFQKREYVSQAQTLQETGDHLIGRPRSTRNVIRGVWNSSRTQTRANDRSRSPRRVTMIRHRGRIRRPTGDRVRGKLCMFQVTRAPRAQARSRRIATRVQFRGVRRVSRIRTFGRNPPPTGIRFFSRFMARLSTSARNRRYTRAQAHYGTRTAARVETCVYFEGDTSESRSHSNQDTATSSKHFLKNQRIGRNNTRVTSQDRWTRWRPWGSRRRWRRGTQGSFGNPNRNTALNITVRVRGRSRLRGGQVHSENESSSEYQTDRDLQGDSTESDGRPRQKLGSRRDYAVGKARGGEYLDKDAHQMPQEASNGHELETQNEAEQACSKDAAPMGQASDPQTQPLWADSVMATFRSEKMIEQGSNPEDGSALKEVATREDTPSIEDTSRSIEGVKSTEISPTSEPEVPQYLTKQDETLRQIENIIPYIELSPEDEMVPEDSCLLQRPKLTDHDRKEILLVSVPLMLDRKRSLKKRDPAEGRLHRSRAGKTARDIKQDSEWITESDTDSSEGKARKKSKTAKKGRNKKQGKGRSPKDKRHATKFFPESTDSDDSFSAKQSDESNEGTNNSEGEGERPGRSKVRSTKKGARKRTRKKTRNRKKDLGDSEKN